MTSLSFTECLNDKITLVTCGWNVFVRQITVIWKTWASVSSKWDNNFQIWSRRVSNVFLNFKMTRVVLRQKRASPLSPLWVTEPRERSATREAWWGRLSEWSNRKSSASDVCHLTHTRTHTRARTQTYTHAYKYRPGPKLEFKEKSVLFECKHTRTYWFCGAIKKQTKFKDPRAQLRK